MSSLPWSSGPKPRLHGGIMTQHFPPREGPPDPEKKIHHEEVAKQGPTDGHAARRAEGLQVLLGCSAWGGWHGMMVRGPLCPEGPALPSDRTTLSAPVDITGPFKLSALSFPFTRLSCRWWFFVCLYITGRTHTFIGCLTRI